METLRVLPLAIAALLAAPAALAAGPLFIDGFDGAGLDGSRWTVRESVGSIGVSGGLLQLEWGDHKDIDSIPTFDTSHGPVVARASLNINGDYQKFGFGVNAAGPSQVGYYFDTWERGTPYPAQAGMIHALVVGPDASGALAVLYNAFVPVPWGEFHELAIERSATEVIFRIDGNEVGRSANITSAALPVGVWNDRAQLLEADWVRVDPVFTAASGIAALTADVAALGLPHGTAQSLFAKLSAAAASLAAGANGDARAEIVAFENEVSALVRTRRLGSGAADALETLAAAVIAAL